MSVRNNDIPIVTSIKGSGVSQEHDVSDSTRWLYLVLLGLCHILLDDMNASAAFIRQREPQTGGPSILQ